MGRKSKEKQTRRINVQKPADSTSKTSLDVKEVTNGESNYQESREGSNENIKAKEQPLSKKKGKIIADGAEKLLRLVYDKRKRTFENFFMHEDQNLSNHLTKELRKFENDIISKQEDAFGLLLGYVNWFEENLQINNYPYVKILLNYVSKTEEFLILSSIEEDLEDRDKAKTFQIHKVINDDEEIASDLGRVDGKNIENVNDCEDIQRQTATMLKSTIEGKGEKYSLGVCGKIQEKDDYPHEMGLEFDDKALLKAIISSGESMEKKSSETKHTKKHLKLCQTQRRFKKITFLEFHRDLRKQLRSLCSQSKSNKETLIACRKTFVNITRSNNSYFLKKDMSLQWNEATKIANAQDDQINDRDLKIVEGYKNGMKHDSSTDCIQIPEENTNECKNKGERRPEDNYRPNDNIEYFNSSKQLLNSAQEIKDYGKETLNPKPSKKVEKQPRQAGKIEKGKYNYTDVNMGQLRNTEVLMANGSTESYETTVEALNNEDRRSGEVSIESEPDAAMKDLDDKEIIHFKYDSNNSNHIFAGNDYYSSKDNNRVAFNYKDENVQVQFTDNQIFISTEDNEFNILIRKSNGVELTEKATQTSEPFSNIT